VPGWKQIASRSQSQSRNYELRLWLQLLFFYQRLGLVAYCGLLGGDTLGLVAYCGLLEGDTLGLVAYCGLLGGDTLGPVAYCGLLGGDCAAKAIFFYPSMNSHRPRSKNTAKERTLIPEKDSTTFLATDFGGFATW
jgi:hypothetical protein